MKPKMTADDFRQWRLSKGMTQQKAADLLGYSNRSMICHFEAGRKEISPRVQMLCEFHDTLTEREKHD